MRRIFLIAILSSLLAHGGPVNAAWSSPTNGIIRPIQSFFDNTPPPVDTQTPVPTQIIPTDVPTPHLTPVLPTDVPTPHLTPVNPIDTPTQTIPVDTLTPAPTQSVPVDTQSPGPTQIIPVDTQTPTATQTPSVGIQSPGVQGILTQPFLDPAIGRLIKAGTIITLVPPLDIAQGEAFILSGTIRDWSGNFVSNASIIFTLNGSYLGQTRSNDKGFFELKLTKPLDAGIYAITATFNGSRKLAFSSAATTLKVSPAEVKIQTIPPIAGVTFQLNGKQFVTGDDGTASIKVDKAGVYRLEALVGLYTDPTQRIEFGRWLEDNYQPFKDIQVPTNQVIQVGINIFNYVGQTFVDLDGSQVDQQRISQFTIRSEQGDTFVLNNGTPRWLPSSRITRRVDGLVITKLLYSVINVKLDGSNVVNESQQQFYAEPNDTWKISLLLYSLKVKVSDGLFGSAAGKSVNLLYPDGQVTNYPLDTSGWVEVHGLARGSYSIEVVGAKGLGNSHSGCAFTQPGSQCKGVDLHRPDNSWIHWGFDRPDLTVVWPSWNPDRLF